MIQTENEDSQDNLPISIPPPAPPPSIGSTEVNITSTSSFSVSTSTSASSSSHSSFSSDTPNFVKNVQAVLKRNRVLGKPATIPSLKKSVLNFTWLDFLQVPTLKLCVQDDPRLRNLDHLNPRLLRLDLLIFPNRSAIKSIRLLKIYHQLLRLRLLSPYLIPSIQEYRRLRNLNHLNPLLNQYLMLVVLTRLIPMLDSTPIFQNYVPLIIVYSNPMISHFLVSRKNLTVSCQMLF